MAGPGPLSGAARPGRGTATASRGPQPGSASLRSQRCPFEVADSLPLVCADPGFPMGAVPGNDT
eukprot:15092140-Alexandrium_andersonii.AAC.1